MRGAAIASCETCIALCGGAEEHLEKQYFVFYKAEW